MNAFKHGGGKGQSVKLFFQKEQLQLEVKDEGPGFVLADRLENNTRLGLVGMRERVESLGGKFWIDTEVNRGTTVNVMLSLEGSSFFC